MKQLDNDVLAQYRHIAETQEEQRLHPKAARSTQHSRLLAEQQDHRLPYKRDTDRIIHSKAYARYGDKTQVVYLVENDHITHRALHVQLVSSFARGIAEILRLNLNLVEAIALGHDVGHAPFGHEGEIYLSQLSQEYNNGFFTHPLQSCRLFSQIEPLNLGLAVYDGFLCHDGGMCGRKYAPHFGKTWEEHLEECKNKKLHPELNIWPGTLEGCLVKLCDTMSYIGRDIEDAIQLGILSRDQIPDIGFGKSNREILSVLARDVIQNSYEQDYIALSEPVYEALKELRKFNFEYIYQHPKLKVESKKVKSAYRVLFETLLNDWEKQRHNSHLWKDFLHTKPESYLADTSAVQMVVDYISGMTDGFFIKTLEALVVPKQITL